LSNYDNTIYENAIQFYPQPIAIACGSIRNAGSPSLRLLAVVKAAEAVCRYMNALGLASLFARANVIDSIPASVKILVDKNLAFGDYWAALRDCANTSFDHPLKAELHAVLVNGKGIKGKAIGPMENLLMLRNDLGHNLAAQTDTQAEVIFQKEQPEENFKNLLEAFKNFFISYPLFLVENSEAIDDEAGSPMLTTRLLLMGETPEPTPEQIRTNRSLAKNRLYVGIKDGLLLLYPMLCWEINKPKMIKTLYFLDSTGNQKLKYEDMYRSEHEISQLSEHTKFANQLNGDQVALRSVTLSDSSSFQAQWREKYQQLKALQTCPLSTLWRQLEPDNVTWYGMKLGASNEGQARNFIQQKLLDNRDLLNADEARQLIILLGKEEEIRKIITRGMLDCRKQGQPGNEPWEIREESSKNVIECLKMALAFYSSNLKFSSGGLDQLQSTSGSADYIVMREGLVNLFIHQDYTDAKTAAQIVIYPQKAIFLNAGNALVSEKALREGGSSTARNPLISRALKLIKFAELAGSGLRKIRTEWQKEKGRPAVIVSDSGTNTFNITLDWTPIADPLVDYWREKIGVTLTHEAAEALLLAGQPEGLTQQNLAYKLNIDMKFAQYLIDELVRQVLVVKKTERYFITEPHRKHIENAPQADKNK